MAPAVAVPLACLTRAPRAWLMVGIWIALAIAAASIEGARGAAHGADHALLDTVGGIVVPLVAYAIVGAVVARDSLAHASYVLLSFGAAPRNVALGALVVSAVATALLGAIVAAAVTVIAHGPSDPPLARDVLTSAWIASLGGAAYAALFTFGATLGKRGGGRGVMLVIDALAGSGTGVVAMWTPRAHLRSLLGGDAPLALSARGSAAGLVAIGALFALLASRRTSLR